MSTKNPQQRRVAIGRHHSPLDATEHPRGPSLLIGRDLIAFAEIEAGSRMAARLQSTEEV
jgi:hypothetical protein